MAMEVGFLGLGIMGKAMATNLLRKGFKLTVWNRTLSKVKQQLLYSLLITQIAIYELCFLAVWWVGGDWCLCWRNPSSCSQEVQVHHCNVIWSISCSFGWLYFMLLSSLLPTVKAINIISLVPFFFSFLFFVRWFLTQMGFLSKLSVEKVTLTCLLLTLILLQRSVRWELHFPFYHSSMALFSLTNCVFTSDP